MLDPVVPLPPPSEHGSDRRRAVGFALTIATVLVAIAAFKLWRGGAGVAYTLGGVAVSLVALSVLVPRAALALRGAWLRLGALLGMINSTIILSVVYFVLVTPIGLVMRVFGKRSFRVKPGAAHVHPRAPRDAKHFERPY